MVNSYVQSHSACYFRKTVECTFLWWYLISDIWYLTPLVTHFDFNPTNKQEEKSAQENTTSQRTVVPNATSQICANDLLICWGSPLPEAIIGWLDSPSEGSREKDWPADGMIAWFRIIKGFGISNGLSEVFRYSGSPGDGVTVRETPCWILPVWHTWYRRKEWRMESVWLGNRTQDGDLTSHWDWQWLP